MGAVFLGEHALLGRRAAIKLLLPELSSDRTNIDRFFNEALATTSVSDPGIVQVFDFGYTPDQTAYIVMEYLEGEQLDARLARLGSLTPATALRFTRQIAGSLSAAHASAIIHRDIKPANLFIVRDPDATNGERIKILDFGIAKLGKEVPNRLVTMTGQVIGTPLYMSPEQCNGTTAIDQRSDVYSLGCVLFNMLTGRPPFEPNGVAAVMAAHLYDPCPRVSAQVLHLPKDLDDLVAKCLAKSPDDRFSNMFELQRACDATLGQLGEALESTTSVVAARTTPLESTSGINTTLSAAAAQPSGVVARSRIDIWVKLGVIAAALALAGAVAFTIATPHDDLGEPASKPGVPVHAAEPAPTIEHVAAPPLPPPSVEIPPTSISNVGSAAAAPESPSKSKPPSEHRGRKPKPKVAAPVANPDLYDERN